MKLALIAILVSILVADTSAQVAVKLLPGGPAPLWLRLAKQVDGSSSPLTTPPPLFSFVGQPTTYTYTQGKLPLFCALEDRIWRRTGLPMQFRLIEQPLGSW